MKTVLVLCALFACANAGIISGILGTIHESFIDPLLGSAQQTAQNLLETYTPIVGQVAQQLTGSVVQGVGGVLTDIGLVDEETVAQAGQALQEGAGSLVNGIGDGLNTLVSGRKRQIEFQTEIGEILHEGVMGLLEHTTQAIQNVQQTLTGAVQSLFGQQPATKGIRPSMEGIQLIGKQAIQMKAKKIMAQFTKAISKERRSRGLLGDIGAAVTTVLQPSIDAAQQAFGQIVDAATAVGQQILDHGTVLVNNVQAQVQQTLQDLQVAAQPFIDDVQSIGASIQSQFQ